MKRLVLPLLAVLLLAGAGAFILHQRAHREPQVASWLPATTIFLEDMPDLHRTADRWPATALAQIIHEPEVQDFLQRPLAELPKHAEVDNRIDQLKLIDPAHFFLAITDWAGAGAPKSVAGLSYKGSKSDLDALIAELRKRIQRLWPAGKSDIEKYGSGEIETFTTPTFSAALAYRGQWLFIATDTALLKSFLDRFEAPPQPDSLADLPAFKSCLAHLPAAPDNLLFIRPALLSDKLSTVALMLNPTADTGQMDSLKKTEAIALTLKLDGEAMRDSAYIITSQPGDTAALARDSLKLSSSDTIVATSERVQALGDVQMPDSKSDPSGVLGLLETYMKAFKDQGLGPDQLAQAFGPETGFVLSWPAGAMIPAPLVMADVRDPAKARKFMDTLASLPLGGTNFTRTDEGGISYYSLPQFGIGFFPLQITLGLTHKAVIGALNTDAIRQAAKRWDSGAPGLDATDPYKQAAALIQQPTMSFTYVDTKGIFDRLYGLFRGVASMGLVPHLSSYVDIGKLPASETISRHLTPIVASGAVKDGGLLIESAGPVSTSQAAIVTVAALGAAAIPMLEQQLKGQSVTIPGFPGFSPGSGNLGHKPHATPLKQAASTNPPTPLVPAISPPGRSPASSASPSPGI
jgi:hypothetical protein